MKFLEWLSPLFAQPAPVPADDRPRCPKCGRVLLRFQSSWLCSGCRCQVHIARQARPLSPV
jgi:hypothetical protein